MIIKSPLRSSRNRHLCFTITKKEAYGPIDEPDEPYRFLLPAARRVSDLHLPGAKGAGALADAPSDFGEFPLTPPLENVLIVVAWKLLEAEKGAKDHLSKKERERTRATAKYVSSF